MKKWIVGVFVTLLVIGLCVAFEQRRYSNSLFDDFQEKLAAKNYEAARFHLRDLKYKYLAKRVLRIQDPLFLRAFTTVDKIEGVSAKERLKLLEAAFFIEAGAFKKGNYFSKKETRLSYDIEQDPETGSRFIHFDKMLGKGKKKIVYYSLLYDENNPEFVARALSEVPLDREMATTKLFKDTLGIYAVRALTSITHEGKKAGAIISKLYNKGSLHSLFSQIYKKKFKPLSLKEKLHVASHILEGLKHLHEKGVVHRDLSSKNYFVSVHEHKEGRKIEVAIADLERALHTKLAKIEKKTQRIKDAKVQGNRSYTPPEAVIRQHFQPDEYFAMDVYAAGCVLHELFYEARPVWRREKFGKDGRTAEQTHAELVQELEMCTKKRRNELESKKELTPAEEFECVVLQMVHVEPTARGQAASLKSKLDRIVAKL